MARKLAPTLCLLSSALLLAASGASAQSVFVIQLGSFPSKQEAEQKWDGIKKSQPEVTNGLSLYVAEAILQPDNVTLYRTQAGPFKSKIDAQTACSKLKAKSECFVVETAMFAPSAPAPQQVAAKAPEPAVALPSLGAAKPQEQKSALPPLPLPPELPATKEAAKPVAPAVVPPVAEKAVAAKTEGKNIAEAKPAAGEEKKSSGWFSWVPNPFSSDDEEDTKKAEAPKAPAQPVPAAPASVAAAPVSPVQQAPAPGANAPQRPGQTIFYATADQQTEKPWAPSSARLEPAAPPPPPAPPALPATTQAAKPTPAILPPLTAPAIAAAPAAIPAPVAPPPPVAAAPLPSAAEFPVTAGAKPITIRAKNATAAPVPPAPPVKVATGDAKVKVAEAIRVPLSSTKKRTVSSANPASFKSMPSQNLGLRSYWAQLSFFTDERSALDFWQGFNASMPKLSDMRVRVVRPYLSRGRAAKASLRVGPFESTDDINKLCKVAASRGLRCTYVADMGTSSVANAPRNRESVPVKYQAPREAGSMAGYWVQLGTYRSAGEAEAKWDELKDSHSDLLKKVSSRVATPALSSSPQAKYRLRAGPFASEIGATNLCRSLKFRGVSCIPVSGN